MRHQHQANQLESGQVLVLFSFLIAVLVVMIVLVVDAGFFMVERRNAQNVVDASALAGAQELPGDTALAESIARDYGEAHGYDRDELDVTFECSSSSVAFCNPSAGIYDTIIVSTTQKGPAFFGPILSLFNADTCWADGCETTVDAGACRGLCGSAGGEVDAVVAIDHTGSMSVTDLQNAKDGALALAATFDATVHQIGLAVTPPVHPSDPCDTIEAWTDPSTWLPVPLTNDYQTGPNQIDPGTPLIASVNCLDRATGSGDVPGPHTDLAEPIVAAMNELLTNGRSGSRKGIVLLSDGASNVYADPAAAAAMGANGPCDYAYKAATLAKAQGLEIYTIAYGADDNCDDENAGSFWAGKSAEELLAAMATDADHYYNSPRTSDLDPVFQAIGAQLGSGSKLVQ
jgi:hypothetical protein